MISHLAGATNGNELLRQYEVFRDDGIDATWSEKLSDYYEKIIEQQGGWLS